MTTAITLAVGLLAGVGVYLLLSRRVFSVILGLSLLTHAANLVVLAAGDPRPVIFAFLFLQVHKGFMIRFKNKLLTNDLKITEILIIVFKVLLLYLNAIFSVI